MVVLRNTVAPMLGLLLAFWSVGMPLADLAPHCLGHEAEVWFAAAEGPAESHGVHHPHCPWHSGMGRDILPALLAGHLPPLQRTGPAFIFGPMAPATAPAPSGGSRAPPLA